jgi:hypothetical protein
MRNPYEHDWLEDEVRVGRAGLRLAAAAFLCFLLLPAASLLLPSLRPDGATKGGTKAAPNLKARLEGWGEGAKTLPLLESWRRADQGRLTATLGAGNQRVFAGREGWLYYRPDLEAIFGKGPFHIEPPSVARERHERPWQPPLARVEDFAAQLAARGIRLVLVPVPTKPMACREGLGLGGEVAAPPGWPALARALSEAGIEFVDLLPSFAELDGDEARYLRQDTHWTPTAMEAAAKAVAARIDPGAGSGDYPAETLERASRGDLVGMLDLGELAGALFQPERASLRRPAAPPGDPAEAELVLLGDSFVNVFEDPGLGFGVEGEESIGAGFAAHLAAALGKPIRTLAINGGGASAVREAFAALPPERFARVKSVVWVLSARDVLLPELPARRAGIDWREVVLPDPGAASSAAASEPREILATLREVSAIEDPQLTPYAEAICSALFETEGGEEVYAFLWAFRERRLDAAAALEMGQRYRLRLVPLDRAAPSAQRATRLDDLFRADLKPWFAERAEVVDGN